MKNGRDTALVIMFAVLSVIFLALIGQVPTLITGIRGIGYVFIIVYSINQSVSWLLYEGRRWRIFAQASLSMLLSLIFVQTLQLGTAMGTILNSFIADSIFNSLYKFFKRKNKPFRWILFAQIYYWTTQPIFLVPFALLFVPMEVFFPNYIPVISVMFPIMIIEAIVGSYIGYKIYRRVENLVE